MMISVWRYSHYILAVSSFLFLLVASITGAILSLEPVGIAMSSEIFPDKSDLSVAELATNVTREFDEVFSIQTDQYHRVRVDGIAGDKIGVFYINPTNGKPLAEVSEQPPVYQLATSLHRSLMLGTFGRIIVGVCSFALLLITISGLFLIARKQGGWHKLLKRGVKENTFGYYHTALSKIVFIPLAILAVSGVFLSLDRFFDLSHFEATHQPTEVVVSVEKKTAYSDFAIFQETPISALRSLEFPFSPDPEDYFKLSLKEKELLVHQYSGEVSSIYHYPVMALLSRTMFALHTGSLGSWWSILLGLTSLTIPFFIVSGFIINRQRSTSKVDNPFNDEAVEYVVVYGSENGSTQQFAMRFHTSLLQAGLRSTCLEMNAYRAFSQIKHLIVFTATYGAGEAPANANAFRQIMQEIARQGMPQFQYAVVGFGSTAYESFCGFAKETDRLLSELPCAAAMKLKTVNNNAAHDFETWLTSWQLTTDTQLQVDFTDLAKKKKTQSFEVLFRRESPNSNDETFLLGLSKGADQFQSGDLLAIYPPGETRERYYSIAKVKSNLSSDRVILLSIKRHAHGKCSKFLSTLNRSARLEGYMVSNSEFHLPSDAKKVVMISNGTGIAPFLGMLNSLDFGCEVSLYWGGQIPSSFALYQPYLDNTHLVRQRYAYSRKHLGQYVQELVNEDRHYIAEVLADQGVIMVCGSKSMFTDVSFVLQDIASDQLNTSLAALEEKGQFLHDCY